MNQNGQNQHFKGKVMKKVKAQRIMIIGLIIALLGLIPIGLRFSNAGNFKEWHSGMELGDNSKIIVHGNILSKGVATDDLFGVSVTTPVLIRDVKMVQWTHDENGARMILANYPIESFELDGKKYNNPKFPITSEVFYAPIEIEGLEIDNRFTSTMIPEVHENYGTVIRKTVLEDLPHYSGELDLVSTGNSYVSASDEWKLGEIKVTYQYIKSTELKDFTLCGNLKKVDSKNIIEPDRENPLIYNSNLSLEDVQERLIGNLTLFCVPVVIGTCVFIFGLFNYRRKETK